MRRRLSLLSLLLVTVTSLACGKDAPVLPPTEPRPTPPPVQTIVRLNVPARDTST